MSNPITPRNRINLQAQRVTKTTNEATPEMVRPQWDASESAARSAEIAKARQQAHEEFIQSQLMNNPVHKRLTELENRMNLLEEIMKGGNQQES